MYFLTSRPVLIAHDSGTIIAPEKARRFRVWRFGGNTDANNIEPIRAGSGVSSGCVRDGRGGLAAGIRDDDYLDRPVDDPVGYPRHRACGGADHPIAPKRGREIYQL